MLKISTLTIVLVAVLVPASASAHCPLCTVGAGVLAGVAAYLGVSLGAIGLLIGAFAMALGVWLAKWPLKKYIPYQKEFIAAGIFLATVWPLMPLLSQLEPVYLDLAGAYGGWWHNTYVWDPFLIGSMVGMILFLVASAVNGKIKKVLNRQFPYQGVVITWLLLLVGALIFQLAL